MAISQSLEESIPESVPISQRIICAASWALLIYCTYMTRLEKKKLIITPARSMTAVENPPRARVIA